MAEAISEGVPFTSIGITNIGIRFVTIVIEDFA